MSKPLASVRAKPICKMYVSHLSRIGICRECGHTKEAHLPKKNLDFFDDNGKRPHPVAARASRRKQPNTIVLDQLLNHSISDKIFGYACRKPRELAVLAKVCYQWGNDIATNATLAWETVCRIKWPYLSINVKPRSWQMFYRKRFQILNNRIKSKSMAPQAKNITIENCTQGFDLVKSQAETKNNDSKVAIGFTWEFQCPVALNRIETTEDTSIDYCSVCKKKVYLVNTTAELEEKVLARECVAFDNEKLIGKRDDHVNLARGRRKRGRVALV